MIDIICLRQAYERQQIADGQWIDGETNPADAMTKGSPVQPCLNLSTQTRLNYRP